MGSDEDCEEYCYVRLTYPANKRLEFLRYLARAYGMQSVVHSFDVLVIGDQLTHEADVPKKDSHPFIPTGNDDGCFLHASTYHAVKREAAAVLFAVNMEGASASDKEP